MGSSEHKVICPYCSGEAELVSSTVVYGLGHDYGPLWYCEHCRAWVGCHEGTTKPLGRLADSELRTWKQRAHAAFDPLWQTLCTEEIRRVGFSYQGMRQVIREAAYAQLAAALSIPVADCHIGYFDVEQCRKVVEACGHGLQIQLGAFREKGGRRLLLTGARRAQLAAEAARKKNKGAPARRYL